MLPSIGRDGAITATFSGRILNTIIAGRFLQSPGYYGCLIGALAAFPLDTVFGAGHIHWTVPLVDNRAVQAGSPVHTAVVPAPARLATTAGRADSKEAAGAAGAGSREAAGAVS